MLKLLKNKAFVSLLSVATLVMGTGLCVNAWDDSDTITTRQSGYIERSLTGHYQKVQYDYGSSAPWDDAYIYGEASSTSALYKYVFVSITPPGGSAIVRDGSTSNSGGITRSYEISGQDYAAYAYAKTETRNGTNSSSTLLHRSRLTVQ